MESSMHRSEGDKPQINIQIQCTRLMLAYHAGYQRSQFFVALGLCFRNMFLEERKEALLHTGSQSKDS